MNKNEKESGFYLHYLEEYLPEEFAGEITPQQKRYLEEFFRLCHGKPGKTKLELLDFWKRIDKKEPEIAKWLEEPNIALRSTSPAAWGKALAEKENRKAA